MHAAVERIRTHCWALAARWAQAILDGAGPAAWWRDVDRVGRLARAGMDALVEALATGRPESFARFAGHLGHEAFVADVPLDEVVRALLRLKTLLVAFLGDQPDAEVLQAIDRAVVAATVESVRRYESELHRRRTVAQQRLDDLRQRLQHSTVVDPATGLFTATYFAAALRREIRRSRRFVRPLTVALLALDREDEIRETWGEAGVRVLTAQLADLLVRHVRQVDVRAVVGPGRLALLLPETSPEGGLAVAERLRAAVEAHPFTLPELPEASLPTTQTVSIALATFPRDGEDEQTLLRRLEETLEVARQERNVTLAADMGRPRSS